MQQYYLVDEDGIHMWLNKHNNSTCLMKLTPQYLHSDDMSFTKHPNHDDDSYSLTCMKDGIEYYITYSWGIDYDISFSCYPTRYVYAHSNICENVHHMWELLRLYENDEGYILYSKTIIEV